MDSFKALLIKALLHTTAALPLSWARALGRGAAWLYWPLGGRSKSVTLRNIQAVFPELGEADQRRLAQRSLAATAELVMEMGHVWLRPAPYVEGLLKEVHGADLVADTLAQGRGVIAMAPHLGNWEVAGLHLASLGPTVALFEPPKLGGIAALMKNARERTGSTLVPTTSRGLAQLLRNVKRGYSSGILPDQVPEDLGSGENSLFMGVPCFTGTLAINMIRRTGALALFGFAERVPGGFIMRYELAEEAIYDGDDAVSLAALNRGVESCVRQCVEQYQWEYKRFRVRPQIKGKGLYD